MQFDIVYERTDAGIGEIHQKSNRLTQSERLVLIMTDGRTDVAALIEKLPSLSMPRVFRAMAKLQEMGLMSAQLVAPVGLGNANDAIAPDVVERFLQQTDLDPATVMRPAAEDFAPTTLPPGMTLKAVAAPRRDDTDLERRLKALMGEAPKFAREDPPRPTPAAPAAPRPAPPVVADVAPEEVVRAAKQAAVATAMATNAAIAPKLRPGASPSAVSLPPAIAPVTKPRPPAEPKRAPRATPPLSTQRMPVQPEPPRQSWALYALMAAGGVLVAYAVIRILLK